MESEDLVGKLRRHPLAVRALDLVASEEAPIRLQGIASGLGVHKVSAHRVMRWLRTQKLVEIHEKNGARYFTIQRSKKPSVQRLVQAVKAVPLVGRGGLSVVGTIEGQVQSGLEARGLEFVASPKEPYDLVNKTRKLKIGIELMTYSPFFAKKFYEIVGHVCVHAGEIPFVVVIILGGRDNRLMKESETIEAFLRKAGTVVRFMWIAESPLEITPGVVEKQIVEPLSRLLRDSNAI
jgi:hypothetical protein